MVGSLASCVSFGSDFQNFLRSLASRVSFGSGVLGSLAFWVIQTVIKGVCDGIRRSNINFWDRLKSIRGTVRRWQSDLFCQNEIRIKECEDNLKDLLIRPEPLN